MTWATDTITTSLLSSSDAECNESAEELKARFENAVPAVTSVETEVWHELLHSDLKRVDWDEVAECVSTKATTVICLHCSDSCEEEVTEEADWVQDDEDGSWFCPDCREDYGTCDWCDERFPLADMVGLNCKSCDEEVREEYNDLVKKGFTLQLDDIVNKPGDVEVATYDYGVVASVLEDSVVVWWFKWGFVPRDYRNAETCEWSHEQSRDLVKINVTSNSYNFARVLNRLAFVGDTVEQTNAHLHGSILHIYCLLKEPSQERLVVKTDEGIKLWDAMMCRKVE